MQDPTLLIVWLFTWLAMMIMASRLLLVKLYKKRQFDLGDYLTMAAMLCAIIRLSLIHVVLIWGTNNVTPAYRATHHFMAEEIYQREIGSKLTITNRVFYNSYLWLQKLVLLDFYRHLIRNLRWERKVLLSYLFVFAGSYVSVQVVTFTECNPFDHYWIVLPEPGTCTQAQVQLITLGVLNIITDVMLIVLPLPVLAKLKRSFSQYGIYIPWNIRCLPIARKIELYILFSLGIFIVAITIIRLPQNASHATAQVNRTTWASTELLTSAFVVNAPALYSLTSKKDSSPSAPQISQPINPRHNGNAFGKKTPYNREGGDEMETGGHSSLQTPETTVTSSVSNDQSAQPIQHPSQWI